MLYCYDGLSFNRAAPPTPMLYRYSVTHSLNHPITQFLNTPVSP